MLVTVTTLSDELFVFDVSPDLDLASLKSLCAIEFKVPVTQISLALNGLPLDNDKKKLKDYKIVDGDVLLFQRIQGERGLAAQSPSPWQQLQAASSAPPAPLIDFGSIAIPGAASSSAVIPRSNFDLDDPAVIREILLNSPRDLALLRERNPSLSDALHSGDLSVFSQVLRQQQRESQQRKHEKLQLVNSDPFDSEAQRRIAEEIRLKNVEHNMETAMEYAPESFGQVSMLYIDCLVNHHPVKAFVDSGAQMTIMSQACAERCNIMRLVDTRWAGVAKGVGVQVIIGRVHLCQVQIGPVFLQCSFSILKDQPMDMLLGLDMLKRHQCIIDLKSNELVIGSSETRTPFLGEADLPPHARLNRPTNDDDRELLEALCKAERETKNNNNSAGTSGESRDSRQLRHVPMEVEASEPTASGAGASVSTFPEYSVRQITDNGFNREQAVEELERSGGNVDEALASLIAKSFTMP